MCNNIKMSSIDWTNILLSTFSVLTVLAFAILIKNLLYKYKRPNGKKGGIISYHVVIAFSIITCIALITRDWFITLLTIILAYLIGKGRLETQHYLYQVAISAIMGVLIPYSIFYLYHTRIHNSGYNEDTYVRTHYDDKPDNAHDDRIEADKASDLKLEEIDDD